jgi:hypothetical protein
MNLFIFYQYGFGVVCVAFFSSITTGWAKSPSARAFSKGTPFGAILCKFFCVFSLAIPFAFVAKQA